MKHSIDDIKQALEFYITNGVHGNRLVIQRPVSVASFSGNWGVPTWVETIEFSLTELKLYNSKLGRAMYVS